MFLMFNFLQKGRGPKICIYNSLQEVVNKLTKSLTDMEKKKKMGKFSKETWRIGIQMDNLEWA